MNKRKVDAAKEQLLESSQPLFALSHELPVRILTGMPTFPFKDALVE